MYLCNYEVHLSVSASKHFACGLYGHEPHLCGRALGSQMRTLRPPRRLLLSRLESAGAVLPVQYPDGTRHVDAPGGRCRPASADAPPPGIALFSTVLVFLPETQIQGFSPTTRFGSNWKVDHRYFLIDDNVSNELRGRDIILFVADRDEISAARYRTSWTSLARCAGRISYY